MADKKISQFDNGGAIQPTDEIAANRGGVNTKVFAGTAAALDTGTDPGEIPTNADLDPRFADVGKVLASPSDSVLATLVEKIVQGTNVGIAVETDSAGSEVIVISASPGGTTLPDGDYGDITVSGSGTVFTIKADAVTTAKILDKNVTLGKIQDIATRKLVGRTSSGSGTAEQIDFIDDDTMASATANNVASAESIKAYIDSKGGGLLLQSISDSYASNVNLITVMPADDTIPTSSEGSLIHTINITPLKSTSILEFTFTAFGACGTASAILSAALYDSSSSAIQACSATSNSVGSVVSLNFKYYMIAGTTSPLTFTTRVGASSGVARLNGNNAIRFFGGISAATLTVNEIDN